MFDKIFLIDSGAKHGAFQMWLDEQLALHLETLLPFLGENIAFLRFYAWQPFCISIGYHQSDAVFNRHLLSQDGIDFVRRPTGGRAVFHAEELTYALVMHTNAPNAVCYTQISLALQIGLAELGIEASLQRQQPDFRTRYAHAESVPCFTASARDELEVKGRKIIGSAQRRYGQTLLQHGSILLSPKHLDMARYLNTAPDIQARIAKDLREKTISASELLGRPVTYHEAVQAFRTGFEHAWHLSLVPLAEAELLQLLGQSYTAAVH
jgi:lipoate-protein ligase A